MLQVTNGHWYWYITHPQTPCIGMHLLVELGWDYEVLGSIPAGGRFVDVPYVEPLVVSPLSTLAGSVGDR